MAPMPMIPVGRQSRGSRSIVVGAVFGKFTVVARGSTPSRWNVKCSCGTERLDMRSCYLGRTLSCGCLRRERMREFSTCRTPGNRLELTGRRFGRLTVLAFAGTRKLSKDGHYSASFWLCSCSCGNETTVAAPSLMGGSTKSCGCLHREQISKAFRRRMGFLTFRRRQQAARQTLPEGKKP
jgi:hypothetical protein